MALHGETTPIRPPSGHFKFGQIHASRIPIHHRLRDRTNCLRALPVYKPKPLHRFTHTRGRWRWLCLGVRAVLSIALRSRSLRKRIRGGARPGPGHSADQGKAPQGIATVSPAICTQPPHGGSY